MSAQLTLAKAEHAAVLMPLVAAFHTEEGLETTEESRAAAISPLLEGSPLGVVYLVGPAKAPIGYIVICFGWSIEFGGMDGFVDELYIRPGVRKRGIAGEVLHSLPLALAKGGLRALHLEVSTENDAAQRLYARSGFRLRDKYQLMTRPL
ncbi:MAG: GNAT family N-acetyltransferase [Pseudomonadota bacterium]